MTRSADASRVKATMSGLSRPLFSNMLPYRVVLVESLAGDGSLYSTMNQGLMNRLVTRGINPSGAKDGGR